MGPQKRQFTAADDDSARRLQSRRGEYEIFPCAPLSDGEVKQGREPPRVDFGVVFEHAGEIETIVDDPPPGGAMAQERADLGRVTRERIERRKARARISRLCLLRREPGAV